MKYPKIQTVFKRDPATNHRTLLMGEYSLPEFELLAEAQWEWTEKIDGTNVRVYLSPDGPPEFRGRTDNAQMPPHLLKSLDEAFPNTTRAEHPMVLYGEGCGAKIQKGGGRYSDTPMFVLFDVLVGDVWLRQADVRAVANEHGLDVAPGMGTGTLTEMVERVRERAGMLSEFGDFEMEGIVAHAPHGLLDRLGNRLITKIKCRDFKEETNA